MGQPLVIRNVTIYNYTIGRIKDNKVELVDTIRKISPLSYTEKRMITDAGNAIIDCTVKSERLCISLEKFVEIAEPCKIPYYPGRRDKYHR